jgi:transcriptional regulator with XRE-family HTH domain
VLEIGSSLREARSRRGLELADVEAATMIRSRYLLALENERFEALPPGSYRQIFLREYADFLGLDGAVYAEDYEFRVAPPIPEAPEGFEQRFGSIRVLARSLPHRWAAVTVVIAVALVGLGAWSLASPNRLTVDAAGSPPSPVGLPTAPAPRAVLTAARGSCWLWVRIGSATGPTVYERTLTTGQTVRFGLGRRLWIRVGAPWNLEATSGSTSLTAELPTRTGDVTAGPSGLGPTA